MKQTISMKVGQIIFFKQAKGTSGKAPYLQFPGLGMGILLGALPPGHEENPPREYFSSVLASLGYIPILEIRSILGEEAFKDFVNKMRERHLPKEEPEQLEAPVEPPIEEGKIRCNPKQHWGKPICDCGEFKTDEKGEVTPVEAAPPAKPILVPKKKVLLDSRGLPYQRTCIYCGTDFKGSDCPSCNPQGL